MHTLRTQDRDRSMVNPVSFHRVPMARGIAFVIRDIERNGAPVDVFSADRRDDVIREHNRQFGTTLKSQAKLIAMFRAGTGNPANSERTTSHCLYADATIGRLLGIHVGGRLPWWACGIDLADRGKHEDVRRFLSIGRKLGYRWVQPYRSGNERHHLILARSPISTLERRKQISKERHA